MHPATTLRPSWILAAAIVACAAGDTPATSEADGSGAPERAGTGATAEMRGRADSTLAITDVTAIPMEGQPLPGATVVIRGDRILAFGPAADVPVPVGARRIDGSGRFLLPGLVDAHVHLRSRRELLSYLRHGVTTVFQLAGTPSGAPDILETRRRIAAGELVGPTIYATGPMIDGDPPNFAAVSVVVTSPDSAARVVERQNRAGFDFLKIYNGVSPEVAVEVIAEGHRRGMPTFGHIPRNPDRATALQKALGAGLDVIAHAEEMFFTYYHAGVEDMLDAGRVPVRDTARVDEAARLIRDAGAFVIPNLSFVAATRMQLDDLGRVLGDPETRFLHPDTRQMWEGQNPTRRPDLERFELRERAKHDFLRHLTKALAEHGVPLLAGTDASAPGLFPGRSLHLELRELVDAGLSAEAALAAATRTPGAFVARHLPDGPPFGVIAPGARADLVLLRENPLEDIARIGTVEGVVAGGRWYSVSEIDALRAAASDAAS